VIRPSPGLVVAVWPGRLELPALGGRAVARPDLELVATFATARHPTIRHAAAAATGDATHEAFHDTSRRLLIRGGLLKVPAHLPDPAGPAPCPADDQATHDPAQNRPPTPPGRAEHRTLETPLSLQSWGAGYRAVGHRGTVLVTLTVDEVLALRSLAPPAGFDPADPPADPEARLDPAARRHLCHRLEAAGLLSVVGPTAPLRRRSPDEVRELLRLAFARAAERAAATERDRQAATGVVRTPVVPVSFTNGPPLALGLIVAHCLAHDHGRLADRYEFRPDWEWDDDRLRHHTARPAVFLGSAYVWSHLAVLDVVRRVKARSPGSLVVLGGPDVPKREADGLRYLADHPEVDVIVRGEGEQTALELLDVLAVGPDGTIDPRRLVDVPGLTVRLGNDVVRTGDRERLTDLDVLPSPFLTGLFDTYRDAPLPQVILETNRGCPYGCTFCDWGSATQSRIRQFDLDRVFGEIDWATAAGAEVISFADANFGIFARDEEIARRVVARRAETGHPHGLGANFAKNTVKHLGPIIRMLVRAGIVNRGLLALQTVDAATLDTVARSNIKAERYDAVATEMRAAGLPFAVELMMGLPGATLASFRADLQQCIDREVEGTVNPTTVLVNSPMNEPGYRLRHGVETAVAVGPGAHALVVRTATFSRDDYDRMTELRRTFLLAENFGAARYVGRLLRQETGEREIDVLERLHADVVHDPDRRERHPYLRQLFGQTHPALVTPVSWRLYVDDLVAYVRDRHPGVHDPSLQTAARVQLALLPAVDRRYPETVRLDHDYPAWFTLVVAAKEAGHQHDWPDHVPPLRSFGPGVLHVDDPVGTARANLGCSVDHGPLLATWEHRSEVSRALSAPGPADDAAAPGLTDPPPRAPATPDPQA
jgi:radical SAM superfamily enzyme YgiQ (UPF0313 family)